MTTTGKTESQLELEAKQAAERDAFEAKQAAERETTHRDDTTA